MRRDQTSTATLEHVVCGPDVIAHLHGEVDLANHDMVQAALNEMVATGKDVVIDVTDLEFMDVATARLIMQAAQVVRSRGNGFFVQNPRPLIRRILILLGMDSLLVLHPTPDAATS